MARPVAGRDSIRDTIHVGLGEKMAEPAGDGAGARNAGAEPGKALRQAGRGGMAARTRPGWLWRGGGGACEMSAETMQAGADQDDERPGETGGETLRRDDRVKAMQDAGETFSRRYWDRIEHRRVWTTDGPGRAKNRTSLDACDILDMETNRPWQMM